MRRIEVSLFEIAQRFVGVKEVPGKMSNPPVLAMLKLDAKYAAEEIDSIINDFC